VAKFIQTCTSQNDLFALGEEGNTKTWVKLVPSRSDEPFTSHETMSHWTRAHAYPHPTVRSEEGGFRS
jgi:hypothetical protein